jgi:hypothetical protein
MPVLAEGAVLNLAAQPQLQPTRPRHGEQVALAFHLPLLDSP